MTELEAQIQKVREIRAALEARTQEHHVLQVEFNRTHAELIESMCKAKNDCAQEESRLRVLTLAAYAADPTNKKPAKGVGIKITKEFSYDAEAARAWAEKENPVFILRIFDKKAFEAFAIQRVKSGGVVGDLKMELREVLQATIAKELWPGH